MHNIISSMFQYDECDEYVYCCCTAGTQIIHESIPAVTTPHPGPTPGEVYFVFQWATIPGPRPKKYCPVLTLYSYVVTVSIQMSRGWGDGNTWNVDPCIKMQQMTKLIQSKG